MQQYAPPRPTAGANSAALEAPTATEAAALRIASSSFAAAIFRNRRPNPDASQFTFAHNALERLIDTLYAVFELAVLDW